MACLQERLAAILPQLDERQRGELARCACLRTLGKGEHLLEAGQPWRHLWLVEQGALRLYYLDSEGREANKNFFLEGQPFWPITPSLLGKPATFHVAAVETCAVHELPMEAIERVIGHTPAWTALRLRALEQLLDEKMLREHLFLQADAGQRYLRLRALRPHWCERLPLRHQASWLGITDVSLSRLRKNLGLAAPPAA